jgi:hypothetical protein
MDMHDAAATEADELTANGALPPEAFEVAPLDPSARAVQREQVLEPLAALDFAVHVSMRYHAKRRAWFDGLHRTAMGVIVLGSSAAAAVIVGGIVDAASDLTIAVALAAALELFFAFGDRARAADALYRRFNALAGDMAEARMVDTNLLRHWDKKRVMIRADCEERLLVLHRICYNLEAEARGYGAEALYEVKAPQRLLSQILSLPPYQPRRIAA